MSLEPIRKLRAVRAIGLPSSLFADVAPKVLAGWLGRWSSYRICGLTCPSCG